MICFEKNLIWLRLYQLLNNHDKISMKMKNYGESVEINYNPNWFCISDKRRKRIKNINSKQIINKTFSSITTNKSWKKFKQAKKWKQAKHLYFLSSHYNNGSAYWRRETSNNNKSKNFLTHLKLFTLFRYRI